MATAPVSRETTNGTKLLPIAGGADVGPKPKKSPKAEPLTRSVIMVDVATVDVGENVRKDLEGIDELAASVLEHGVLQPIKVRAHGDRWVVVWGQRRLLAARKAGLERIPAITTADELEPAQLSTEQLVENLHRADLNPMDRARAMKAVVESGTKQADLARQLGLAPSTVANDIRLLEAAPEVQAMLEEGTLTPAHSRAIQALDLDLQADFAERARTSGWSAHETERQSKWVADQAKQLRKKKAATEKRLAEALELLAKVATADKSTVAVADYSGGDLGAALKKAGWTVADGWSVSAVDKAGSCGCKGVWRIEVPYQDSSPLALKPACSSKAHQQAAQQRQRAANEARWKKESEERAAQQKANEEAQDRRRAALVPFLAEHPTDPFAVRVALAVTAEDDLEDLIDETYRAAGDDDTGVWDLVKAIPDAELGTALARAIARRIDGAWWIPAELLADIDERFGLTEAPEAVKA